jgi:hypothetical protein
LQEHGASPAITRVNLEGNPGGIYVDRGSPVLTDVLFAGNGVGLDCIQVTSGDTSPILSDCRFYENGEGMRVGYRVFPCLTNVEFVRSVGVGLDAGYGPAKLPHCSFIEIGGGHTVITNTIFLANSGNMAGAIYIDDLPARIANCTFVGNAGPQGSALSILPGDYTADVVLENVIMAYGGLGPAVYCWPSTEGSPVLSCCNVYGNDGGDWVGCIAEELGVNGNFSACPSFCGADLGDLHLCDGSPCAPGNHPYGYDCGLVGALGVGCACGPSRVEPTTWGSIKSIYR